MARVYRILQALSDPVVLGLGALLLGVVFTGASAHVTGVIWGG